MKSLFSNKILPGILFICYLSVAFIIISCSAGEGKEVLSFFFDGVEDETFTNQSDSLEIDENKKNLPLKKPIQVMFYHEVYREKQCDSCHDIDAGYDLLESQPALCYNCHDDFGTQFSVLHGPIISGYCTECHSPHLAKSQKLLKRNGRDLCLHCHNANDVYKNETHAELEDANCLDCHNPHGGDDRFLM